MAHGYFGVLHKSVQYVIARHFMYVFSKQGCTNPGRQNFVLWLVFLGPEYGTCVMLAFWLQTFCTGCQVFGRFVDSDPNPCGPVLLLCTLKSITSDNPNQNLSQMLRKPTLRNPNQLRCQDQSNLAVVIEWRKPVARANAQLAALLGKENPRLVRCQAAGKIHLGETKLETLRGTELGEGPNY